jgi:hypothetical protein
MVGLATATGQFTNPYLDAVTGLPKTGTTSPWIGSQTQAPDTVAGNVATLAGKDSELNRMAKTEGLKAANSRGLLNSSMAVGAAQDAVLKNVLPIAQQDAGQAFLKNRAAQDFEYGMTAMEGQQQFQSGERLGGQQFLTSERTGTQQFQTAERTAAEIFQSGENVAARTWQTAENLSQRNFLGTQADLDRDLQTLLQQNQITSQEGMFYANLAQTAGIEAANRQLQRDLLDKDLAFRMKEGNLDRASAERMQAADIASDKIIATLSRDLQQTIASWNVKSTDKAAAAQYVSNVGTQYTADVDSINSNTNMSAAARTTALTAAKNRYNTRLNLGEQLFAIDLKWVL